MRKAWTNKPNQKRSSFNLLAGEHLASPNRDKYAEAVNPSEVIVKVGSHCLSLLDLIQNGLGEVTA